MNALCILATFFVLVSTFLKGYGGAGEGLGLPGILDASYPG